MANNKKFAGCPYPLFKNPRGYFRTQTGVDQIKSDLLILLLTNPGERIMQPDFGTPLKTLIFDPNDSELAEEARTMIINSINKWEPRITVTSIEITPAPDITEYGQNGNPDGTEYILGIKINFFDPDNIQQIQELVLEIPMAGGN